MVFLFVWKIKHGLHNTDLGLPGPICKPTCIMNESTKSSCDRVDDMNFWAYDYFLYI